MQNNKSKKNNKQSYNQKLLEVIKRTTAKSNLVTRANS